MNKMEIANLEISGICNYNCIICVHKLRQKSLKVNMNFDMVKCIFDQLETLPEFIQNKNKITDNTRIGLCSYGEPLLNLDVTLKTIKEMERRHYRNGFIATNSYFLTEEISKILIESPSIFKIVLSIYGWTENDYNKTTGTIGKFSQFKCNIEKFLELSKNSVFDNKHIVLSVVPNSKAIESIRNQYGNRSDIRILDMQVVNVLGLINGDNLANIPKGITFDTCQAIHNELIFWSNGEIGFCDNDVLHESKIGHINDMNVNELYHSEIMNNYRKKYKCGNTEMIPACNHCELRNKLNDK